MRYLIDTSVLLRLRSPDDPNHDACSDVLDLFRVPVCDAATCAQVLIEYWAVATRPVNVNGFGLSTADAYREIREVESSLPVLPEPPNVLEFWRQLVTRFGVQGRPTHDARLVALMDAHGITGLITLNPRDFTRYPHLTVLKPQEWLAANPRQPAP